MHLGSVFGKLIYYSVISIQSTKDLVLNIVVISYFKFIYKFSEFEFNVIKKKECRTATCYLVIIITFGLRKLFSFKLVIAQTFRYS